MIKPIISPFSSNSSGTSNIEPSKDRELMSCYTTSYSIPGIQLIVDICQKGHHTKVINPKVLLEFSQITYQVTPTWYTYAV